LNDSGDDSIPQARRWFAEELRFVTRAGVSDVIDITRTADVADVIEAFATVPRERFVRPGPLRILSPWDMRQYWTPADQSAAAVYHNVLIACDEARRLNNGLPGLWAFVLDKLGVARGERVLHLGCGMGYYTAILAELVGSASEVVGVEMDQPLAEKAREALASWSQVKVAHADGAAVDFGTFDVIVASAGATHPLPLWLDCLAQGGRLVFPMTVTNEEGGMLLVRRRTSDRFDARFLCAVAFYEFAGARDAEISNRLKEAFARDRGAGVKSVRTDRHADDDSCWLHGDGWCLSRREIERSGGQVI
jgi:protein-L-isoaspartate(D-aspartate) O-methyltransferase